MAKARKRYVSLSWRDTRAPKERQFRDGNFDETIVDSLLESLYDFGRGIGQVYVEGKPFPLKSLDDVHNAQVHAHRKR